MDVIGYIGDVHAHFYIAVGQTAHRKRIVEILGVGGIDREGRNAAEIPPGGDFVCGQLGRDFVGFLLHLFGIGIRKVVFGQDRMHFGVVVTRSTQYVDNLTRGIFHRVGPFGDPYQHFLTVFCSLQVAQRNEYVGRELAAVHFHECETVRQFQYAHVFFVRMFEYLDYLSFGVHLFFCLAGDRYLYAVAVQHMAGVPRVYIDIFVQAFDCPFIEQGPDDAAHFVFFISCHCAGGGDQVLNGIALVRQGAEQL